ncbi:MAG: LemA family protein [Xanthomonadales bacterium]|nr:LemA family protein [Xanthomonadales bacterium]MDH3941832.1 LemA family protein [Xanthomonadales bacterium]
MGYAFLAAGLLVLAWVVWTYNRLVRNRNRVDEAWAGIDVQLQRRYDLVPNLVKTVQAYMQHESRVLERVTALRGNPGMQLPERSEQESGLSRSLGRLFALAEDYPELKASEGFQQLHASLVRVEQHLQFARRYYNGSVRDNNNFVESFPAMLVARLFGFISAAFFEIELASQRSAPVIDLEHS